MRSKNLNINNLSKKEINSILESLIFSCSVDVCADWYKEDNLYSLKLAKKIRKMFPEIILENVYLYEDEKIKLHDEHSKDIKKHFPETKKKFKNI